MGDVRIPESLHAVQSLFNAMAQSQAYTIIAGGDSCAAADILGVSPSISYLSTGGGAFIAYISGKPLPALDLVLNK
jgi:phosphoglycerate kinase